MEALQNEVIVKELNQKKIKLTNLRLRFYSSRNTYTSVMLDKISLINVVYYENKKYLHYSIISGLGILLASRFNFQLEIPFVLAAIFYLAYIFHKKKVVSINCVDNNSVKFSVSGLSTNQLDDFIQEIEKQSFQLKNMIKK